MSGERELVVDLMIIIAAATGGGVLASILRLPVVLGYLIAGLVVGHYIPGLDIEVERVQDIAELGVALLLFTLGVQFSPNKLRGVRRVALLAGIAQIVLTVALGVAVARGLGLGNDAGLVLGAAMALSSTMVVLKLLDGRRELDAPHGRVAIGMLLVQDLAVGPLVILVPAAAGEGGSGVAGDLALAAGKAVLLLGGAYLLGAFVVPRLLFRVAAAGFRELFVLSVLSLALGLAAGSFALGLGLAFGAFLAGLVVSESEFSYQTLAEVLPLRDVFATIFFVSMGLLIDPDVLADRPEHVIAISAALVFGKLLIVTLAVSLTGYSKRSALLVGLALAQGGEFSFVLAQLGIDEGLISEEFNSAILMSAFASILLSPLLMQTGPPLLGRLERHPIAGRFFAQPVVVELGVESDELRQHVVICGYGQVGRELVQELQTRGLRSLVVDANPYRAEQLRREGVPYVYGDAGNAAVLSACGLDRARVLIVTLPDPAVAQAIVTYARRRSDRLDIIVRGRGPEDYQALLRAGASEVVQPEVEAGLEFLRHTLHRFGVDRTQLQALLARKRRDAYRQR